MRISDWSSDVCSSDLQAEQAAFDVVGNSQSRRCGQGAAARALEKFHAQAFFHARNGLAKSGLRDAQLMGGLTDGAVFQHGQEVFELRSVELRVGKGCVSTCRYRGSPYI